MKEAYRTFNFGQPTVDLIVYMNSIVSEYMEQGYVLTVRQLYYQLVARDKIPNTLQSYKRIASIINDARLAGLMDWDAIEDRTREFSRRSRWTSGRSILEAVAAQFHMDMWAGQPCRPFVIIEKEALVGVLEPTCNKFDTPILAARGYPSASVLREFVRADVLPNMKRQEIVILHLGDHDPSGIDMTRDLQERIGLFGYGRDITLKRIALSIDQVEEHEAPPNPAKATDSRFADYRAKYGDESWELDALPPNYLAELVEGELEKLIVQDEWEERQQEIDAIKERMIVVAADF